MGKLGKFLPSQEEITVVVNRVIVKDMVMNGEDKDTFLRMN